MGRQWMWIVVALLVTSFSSCKSANMSEVPPDQLITAPAPDRALIVFMRPSKYGGAIQASVFDEDVYVGTVSSGTQVAYQATPGEHMFMLVGESADFMRATLNAGKTYYAVIQARPGFLKARFSFRPNNGQMSEAELTKWLDATVQVVPNAEGLDWAQKNAESIAQKKAKYLPVWENKADESKQILNASSGK